MSTPLKSSNFCEFGRSKNSTPSTYDFGKGTPVEEKEVFEF